jgi:hypothetical protein
MRRALPAILIGLLSACSDADETLDSGASDAGPVGVEIVDSGIQRDGGFEDTGVVEDLGVDAGDSGFDAGQDSGVDAGVPYDFSCVGDPPASTATATVTLSGRVTISNGAPAEGVRYEIVDRGTDVVIATATSALSGAWSIDLDTGGAPRDVYVRFGKAGYVTDARWFADPLVADLALPTDRLVTPAQYESNFPPPSTADPTRGTIFLRVVDCSQRAVEGVTIELDVLAETLLFPDSNELATGPPGTIVALNVPVGPVEIRLRRGATEFQVYTVRVEATSTSTLIAHP